MNTLDRKGRVRVIAALVEGNSVHSTSRTTGIARNTILGLLADMGEACLAYQDHAFRNLQCKRLQCDEIWSFCNAKEKNVPAENRGKHGFGDVWTWVSVDADTKLIPCWLVGKRAPEDAKDFIADLAGRLAHRVQLSTDGLRMYVDAVDEAFGSEIDYGMIIKMYGLDHANGANNRYSMAVCIGARKTTLTGNPDHNEISTSYIERRNLTMRMGMRRFTRLTNAFSKKIENHMAAIALHYMHYNFGRPHMTLSEPGMKRTPAMAAGLADHVWSVEEIVAVLEAKEQASIQAGEFKRGKYGPRSANSN